MNNILKFFNDKGQICGYILQDGIYRKKVNSKKHRMRLLDGYGIDERIVKKIKDLVPEIRILETDTNNIYSISMSDFLEHSVVRNFEGEQRFCSVKYFTLSKLSTS